MRSPCAALAVTAGRRPEQRSPVLPSKPDPCVHAGCVFPSPHRSHVNIGPLHRPPSRQAEVVPLSEGLMELMDEDRDDAAGFADFLRVSV